MKELLEFLCAVGHLFGLLLVVGGHLVLAVLAGSGLATPALLARLLPRLPNLVGVGMLLLFASGATRVVLWGGLPALFLPEPYGWVLLAKLSLYCLVVGLGIVIERRYLPRLQAAARQAMPSAGSGVVQSLGAAASTPRWEGLLTLARVNFLLVAVIAALGLTLKFLQVKP